MKELKKYPKFTLYETDKGQKVISFKNDVYGMQNGKIICFTDLTKTLKAHQEKDFLQVLTNMEADNSNNEPEKNGSKNEQDNSEKANQSNSNEEEKDENENQKNSSDSEQNEEENESNEEKEEENEEEPEQPNENEEQQEEEQENLKSPVYEEVKLYLSMNMPVYLYGPAGTGKSYLARQIADDLGLDFYFTNCVTQEFKLTGFIDANGKYQETAFYKAMKYGGLFFLDEMDGSDPAALINLNSALADGYFQFPHEFVQCHENFRVIAAGNTAGQGADENYTGRYQLDASSLNRFKKVSVGYELNIERLITNNNTELIEFAHYIRQESENSGIQLIVSYRDLKDIAKLEKPLGIEKILKSTIFYNTTVDSLNTLIYNYSGKNKYINALKRLVA